MENDTLCFADEEKILNEEDLYTLNVQIHAEALRESMSSGSSFHTQCWTCAFTCSHTCSTNGCPR